MKKYIPYILAGAAGALPIAIPAIGFLHLVLLIPFGFFCLSEEKRKAKIEYFCGLLFFFGYFAVCYSWFFAMYPLSVTGMSRIAALAVVILASFGIALFQALGFAFIFLIARKVNMSKYLFPFFVGALWCIGEWVQNFFWFGLPFVRIALSQTNAIEFCSSANLFGSYFVSFIIVTINMLLALSFKEKNKKAKTILALFALIIFVSNSAYGVIHTQRSAKNAYPTVKVSAFQGNISTEEKWSDTMLDRSLIIYERLAKEAADAGAEYILLPETVIPYVTEEYDDIDSFFTDLAWHHGIKIMLGTFGRVDDGTGNIIRIYEPMRKPINVYTKQKPVPFGEYIPMRGILTSLFPPLGEINILQRSLTPGNESTTWEDEGITFGYLICFDSIYSSLARESIQNGADILMISTNDSWFGTSHGLTTHLTHAKLRAIENGRSVLRAANTGISAAISPHGEVIEIIGADETGQITVSLPIAENETLYTKIGDWFVYFSMLFAMFCIFFPKKRNKSTVPSS